MDVQFAKITQKHVDLDGQTYPHPGFYRLLAILNKGSDIPLKNVSVEEKEDSLAVIGQTTIFDTFNVELEVTINTFAEEPFAFQVRCRLKTFKLNEAPQFNLLPANLPIFQLPEFPVIVFPDVDFLFDSEDESLMIMSPNSGVNLDIGIMLNDLGFEISKNYSEVSTLLHIYAAIPLGSQHIECVIEIPIGELSAPNLWTLSSTAPVFLDEGIETFTNWMSSLKGFPEFPIPSWLSKKLSYFKLASLAVSLDCEKHKLKTISGIVEAGGIIEITKEFKIDKLGLSFLYQSNGFSQLSLFGTMKFKGGNLGVFIEIPLGPGENECELTVEVKLPFDNLKDIQHLPGNEDPVNLHLPETFLNVDKLEVYPFKVRFHPEQGIKQVFLDIFFYLDLHLTDKITLSNPKFQLEMNRREEMQRYDFTGSNISTFLDLADARFELIAEKIERGWHFEGNQIKNDLKIGTFTRGVTKTLGLPTLPSFINDMKLREMALALDYRKDPDETHFTFRSTGVFPLQGNFSEMAITTDLGIAYGNNQYLPDVKGNLSLMEADGVTKAFQFDYAYQKSEEFSKSLMGRLTWESEKLNVSDLISGVSTEIGALIPQGLEVQFQGASFLYLSEESKKKFLISVKIGLDVDIKTLPLFGSVVADDLLSLDHFQFLFASNTIKDLSEEGLPKEIAEGFYLTLTGSMTGENFDLLLPFYEPTEASRQPVMAVEVATASDSPPKDIWKSVQRDLGPVFLHRIGLRFETSSGHPALLLMLDASIAMGPVSLRLMGLGVGSRLDKLQPMIHLDGLAVSYHKEPIEISGSLAKVNKQDGLKFDGTVIIKAKDLSIAAIGSYETNPDYDSLFIYAEADKRFGGPPYFLITGIKLGIGYNSTVAIPTLDQLDQFPFLKGFQSSKNDPADVLREIQQPTDGVTWVKPEKDTFWLAAGLTFETFNIVKSRAVVVGEFGEEFFLSLVGKSTIQYPPSSTPYVYAELLLGAVFKPESGFIGVHGKLSNNSYLLDRKCRLRGGFAFYMWYGPNPHAGDFVMTMGGYHPRFRIPAHYPRVPRVGFNWQVSSKINISGELYFAMTPSAMMVGGRLNAVYQDGALKAWFMIYADFLVNWNPFWFMAAIGVRLGASYTLRIFGLSKTFKLELGASLKLWGPPTGGIVKVKWTVISFTVAFGKPLTNLSRKTDWHGFKKLLPDNGNSFDQLATLSISDGLTGMIGPEKDTPLFSTDGMSGTLHYYIPYDRYVVGNKELGNGTSFRIKPMDTAVTSSNVNLSLTLNGKSQKLDDWSFEAQEGKTPAALWGEGTSADPNQKPIVLWNSITIRSPRAEENEIGRIEKTDPSLVFDEINKDRSSILALEQQPLGDPKTRSGDINELKSLSDKSVIAARNRLVASMEDEFPELAAYNDEMQRLAEYREHAMQDHPMVAA